ncbi:hypothetical protein SAMN05216602_0515 [Pseudomonas argentinensis]|uniref:Uncharacterized protein n=1 Tax=Phytopseudomonas argentinensis TaxID=289370 RepID=A0A1I3H0C0_9GAMM|nr:hypothetical protein SAMN05216602_0515 [Pseudomonas argentinensis]
MFGVRRGAVKALRAHSLITRNLFFPRHHQGTSKTYLRCHRGVKNRLKMLIYNS